MKNKPLISIIASAYRPQFWADTYNSINTSKVSIEIIFVTGVKPTFNVPSNMRWIYSTVKPVQCVEIAFRETQGEIIHWSADDTTYNEKAFDYSYNLYRDYGGKNMICFRNFESVGKGWEEKTDMHFLFKNVPLIKSVLNPLRVMPYGLISRKLFEENRLDRRFIAGQWENDIVLGAYSKGAKMIVCDKSISYADHKNKHKTIKGKKENHLYETHTFESNLLRQFWVKNDTIVNKRLEPIQPFEDKNLLTISQSNKGKWK